MVFNRSQSYNHLPPLPPDVLLETHEILKKAIHAHRILAELKHVGNLLPNQAILIQTLGLQEAKLSSEIENIVTTNDELYRAYVDKDFDKSFEVKEVLNYPSALWYGFRALKEKKRLLTTTLFEEICQNLKGNQSGIRKLPGTKLTNHLGEIIYTPLMGKY
jgi:Fic family protein